MIFSSSFDQESATPTGELLTVREAVTRYLNLRINEGIIENSDTYRHMRKHLAERLCDSIGNWPIADVSTEHLREWSSIIRRCSDGHIMSEVTHRSHLVSVKTFFKRAFIERWVEADPTRGLMLPSVEEKDVNVIPVDQAFNFFAKNRDARCIGRVALEAFGGLRFSSAGKLVRNDLKLDQQGIEMPSNKHKSRRRRFRQGQPANLWTWINHAPEDCWTLTIRQYADEKRDAMIMGGLRPIRLRTEEDKAVCATRRNVWRHSFASYLLARTKDFGPVAYLMQHEDNSTTEIYEGRGLELDAAIYFSITPATVLLPWETFRARVTEHFVATQKPSIAPLMLSEPT